MTEIRSVILGCGSYLPDRILTNADLEEKIETTDEWIVQRTGIRARHIAANDQVTSDLGFIAAKRALDNSGVSPNDIDLIILATATPDSTFPATAVTIQNRLGMSHGAAFDLQAVCSGFLYALTTADVYIRSGLAKRILVIGAETFSRILDWEDRSTCVLFGDGSGALVLEAQEVSGQKSDRGILSCQLRSDGQYKSKLYVDGGPSSTQTTGFLRMEGREVFKHAVGMVTDVMESAFAATSTSVQDLDWFIPHQANKRIIDATTKKMNIPPDKVVITVENHGNTSAASVPLAIDTAVKDGRVKCGDLVMLEAMGGGFTWGAVLLRW